MTGSVDEFLEKAEALKKAEEKAKILEDLEAEIAGLRDSGPPEELARVLMALAERLGADYERTAELSFEAAALYKDLHRAADAADALEMAALSLHEDAEELIRTHPRAARQERRDAVAAMKDAIAILMSAGESQRLAEAHLELAEQLITYNLNFEDALPHCVAAEAAFRENGPKASLAECLYSKARALDKIEDPNVIIEILKEALSIYRELGDEDGQMSMLGYIAYTARHTDLKVARAYAEAGMAIARKQQGAFQISLFEELLRSLPKSGWERLAFWRP